MGRGRHGHPRRPRRRAADHGDLLQEAESAGDGIRSYEDYREMLEKETDIQGIVNITPDHQHGSINISALRKGKAAISHKPVASVLHEVRRTLQAARESSAPSASARVQQQRRTGTRSRRGSTPASIGTVREVHNWTNRPFWPQGMAGVPQVRSAGAGRIQLGAVAGARTRPSVSPELHLRLYRGWYAYGAGCLGDMGLYSLWQPYRILNLGVPEFVEARPNNDAIVNEQQRQRRRSRVAGRPSRRPAPSAGAIPRRRTARRSTRSGTTAA